MHDFGFRLHQGSLESLSLLARSAGQPIHITNTEWKIAVVVALSCSIADCGATFYYDKSNQSCFGDTVATKARLGNGDRLVVLAPFDEEPKERLKWSSTANFCWLKKK